MSKLRRFLERLMAEVGQEETLDLAAGEETKIECGRSGVFVDMSGTKVPLTPAHLAGIAESFDAEGYHKLKIGHAPIDTATPDYGDVVGLEYDKGKDRLLARVVPTPVTVEKNHKEGFRRCSMELLPIPEDSYRLDHIALLGARRPAISGLAPIALAKEDGEGAHVFLEEIPEEERPTFVLAKPAALDFAISAEERKKIPAEDFAGPGETFPIRNQDDVTHAAMLLQHAADPAAVKKKIISIAKRKGLKMPATWSEAQSQKVAAAAPPEKVLDKAASVKLEDENKETQMAETVELAQQKERLERLQKKLRDGARDRAKAFLAANAKKIPLKLKKAGIEDKLTALLAMDAETEQVIKFAGADGKETAVPIGEMILALLAELPEQTTPGEETEVTTEGKAGKDGGGDTSGLPAVLAEMTPDPQGDEYLLAANVEITAAKAGGETIDFAEAARRVYAKKGARRW